MSFFEDIIIIIQSKLEHFFAVSSENTDFSKKNCLTEKYLARNL